MSPNWWRGSGPGRGKPRVPKTAVVLFNLGGPDCPEAVEPFLFNLFNDPAILNLPGPFRWVLAKLIARTRGPKAREIYAKIGGSSPLLENTEAQARALEQHLGPDWRCFIAMRYWHPFASEAVNAIRDWGAERVVLLPLYPQFSTTTTASSLAEWARMGLDLPTRIVESYPQARGFVAALAGLTAAGLLKCKIRPRVLFSAHGLPKKIVDAGDPYPSQVEMTVAAVVEALAIPDLDWVIAYQSRVGPLEWIGPSVEAEIDRAGREGLGLLVVPVAFVSEHSETLVELDIEYRHRAEKAGVVDYVRVPAVGADPRFIEALGDLVASNLVLSSLTEENS